MISELKTLLKVKELREEKALAWVKSRQDAVAAAERLLAEARAAVAESGRTLPEREAGVWARVMGKVVEQGEIDLVAAEVQDLEKEHQRLVDKGTRAEHVLEKRREELVKAQGSYREAQKAVDKYRTLVEEAEAEAARELAGREEAELEEIAGRRVA